MAPPTTPDRPTALAAALLLTLAALLSPVVASAHDGAIRWRTIHTARVAVHHPAGYEVFARLVAATAEDALTTLKPVLPYVQPRRL